VTRKRCNATAIQICCKWIHPKNVKPSLIGCNMKVQHFIQHFLDAGYLCTLCWTMVDVFWIKFLSASRLYFIQREGPCPNMLATFWRLRRSPSWLGANFQTIKWFYGLSFNQWQFCFLHFRSNFSMRRDRTLKSSSFTWMLVYRKSTRPWIRWRINVVRKLGFVRNFQWLTALSSCYLCRDTELCRFNTLYYAFFAFFSYVGGRATEEFVT